MILIQSDPLSQVSSLLRKLEHLIWSGTYFFEAVGSEAELGKISKRNFRISAKLETKLRDISKEIHQGRGFVTLRGLDKARFADRESTIAFVGLAAHVCPQRAVSQFSGLSLAMGKIRPC